MPPKYSLPEIERRWLVDVSQIDRSSLAEPTLITDRYLTGTRLRLRKMESVGEVIYKLVKKHGREGWVEAITNLYLTREEYEALSVIPATEIIKQRYRLEAGSLDMIQTKRGEIVVFEIEFESVDKAAAFTPPSFTTAELLGEPDWIPGSS